MNRTADRLLTGWTSLEADSISNAFISDKLHHLSQQRGDLESGMTKVDGALDAAKQGAMDVDEVRRAIWNISEVYGCLQPLEQKELMQLILQGAEINEREMVLEIRTGICLGATGAQRREAGANGEVRFEPPNWLPG